LPTGVGWLHLLDVPTVLSVVRAARVPLVLRRRRPYSASDKSTFLRRFRRRILGLASRRLVEWRAARVPGCRELSRERVPPGVPGSVLLSLVALTSTYRG